MSIKETKTTENTATIGHNSKMTDEELKIKTELAVSNMKVIDLVDDLSTMIINHITNYADPLEYGESIVEVQEGEGKVLVFDDVLATGGTAKGSIDVLKKAGYTPTSALFLVELDFLNPKLDVPHESVIHYE